MDVRMPLSFTNVVVSKISLSTIIIDIASKLNFTFQSKSMERMFNGTNATERGCQTYSSLRMRKFLSNPISRWVYVGFGILYVLIFILHCQFRILLYPVVSTKQSRHQQRYY